MSGNVNVCDIDPEVLQKLKKFRFRKEKTNAAYILKINREDMMVVLDVDKDGEGGFIEDCDVDELRAEIPESFPRFVVYSFEKKWDDGRISYPMAFIFFSPSGTKPELQMMYAGSKLNVVSAIGASKVYELRDVEEFTEEWLMSQKF